MNKQGVIIERCKESFLILKSDSSKMILELEMNVLTCGYLSWHLSPRSVLLLPPVSQKLSCWVTGNSYESWKTLFLEGNNAGRFYIHISRDRTREPWPAAKYKTHDGFFLMHWLHNKSKSINKSKLRIMPFICFFFFIIKFIYCFNNWWTSFNQCD